MSPVEPSGKEMAFLFLGITAVLLFAALLVTLTGEPLPQTTHGYTL